MLWTVAAALALLWGFALVTSYTLGGFIHVMLALALAPLLVRVFKTHRRRAAGPLGPGRLAIHLQRTDQSKLR